MAEQHIIRKVGGKWENTKAWKKQLDSLPDGNYKVTIVKSNRRSNQQNRYYFGLVVPMIKEAFYNMGHDLTTGETHEFLKSKFNSKEIVNEQTGEMIELPKSTAGLNKESFSNYIEQIQRFAATFLGINIPDPGQQILIDV
jgi:lipopolysaccharide biosynthesis regulator YciM